MRPQQGGSDERVDLRGRSVRRGRPDACHCPDASARGRRDRPGVLLSAGRHARRRPRRGRGPRCRRKLHALGRGCPDPAGVSQPRRAGRAAGRDRWAEIGSGRPLPRRGRRDAVPAPGRRHRRHVHAWTGGHRLADRGRRRLAAAFRRSEHNTLIRVGPTRCPGRRRHVRRGRRRGRDRLDLRRLHLRGRQPTRLPEVVPEIRAGG